MQWAMPAQVRILQQSYLLSKMVFDQHNFFLTKREPKMFFVGALLLFSSALAEVLDYETLGAIPNDDSYDVALKNGNLLNETLANLHPGDRFVIPNKTFTLVGGIMASNIMDVVFQIDGTSLSCLFSHSSQGL
jgi:hypothetical protein